jgi:hypothetical protein
MGKPGSDKTYMIDDGIIELDDPMGMPVPGQASWDPTGSPTLTADPDYDPFGPALVLKPFFLGPNVTYTTKITAAKITDRKGNPLADQNGNPVSGVFTKTFKTEDLAFMAPISSIDPTGMDVPEIAPNDVITLGFNSGVDETSAVCTVDMGGTAVPVTVYSERGAKAASCSKPANGMVGAPGDDLLINIFPGTTADPATALPVMTGWAEGTYNIDCTFKDDSYGMGTPVEVKGSFTVKGPATDPMEDSQDVTNHVFPAQCTK